MSDGPFKMVTSKIVYATFLMAAAVLGMQSMDEQKKKGSRRNFLIFCIVWSSLALLEVLLGGLGKLFMKK